MRLVFCEEDDDEEEEECAFRLLIAAATVFARSTACFTVHLSISLSFLVEHSLLPIA